MKISKPRKRASKKTATGARPNSDAEILALFRKAEAAWKASRRQLEAALGEIEDAAITARGKSKSPRNSAYADGLDMEIRQVRNAVEADNAADAALCAIRLTRSWLRKRYQ